MTKIAFVADVHVSNSKRWGGAMVNGVNKRGQEVVDALAQASACAAIEVCEAFVVLGDLFDHTRPTPQLVRATADALRAGLQHRPDMKVIVLLGNHDIQSDGETDHACASLALVPGIEVISKPMVRQIKGVELVIAPYLPGLASEWLPASITACVGGRSRAAHHRRVLATHLGVWDEDTPPFMKTARDAVSIGQMRFWCEANEINTVFAGNWHAYQCFASAREEEADVVIPGTLTPAGFQESDQNRVGWMIIYDSAANNFQKLNIKGPRWYTAVVGQHEGALDAVEHATRTQATTQMYVRIKCSRDQLDEAMKLRDTYEMLGSVALVEIDEDARTLVQDAAKAAVAASQGEGPVADYAALVDVPEPGTREGVARRLMEYRKAAL